jgi:preprotein translocase subunit SecF
MRILGKTNINFMGTRKTWYVVSAGVILLGMVSLFIKGIDLGIDFLGGTELVVSFTNAVEISDARVAMARTGLSRRSAMRRIFLSVPSNRVKETLSPREYGLD